MKTVLAALSGAAITLYPAAPAHIAPFTLPANAERMAPMVLNGYSSFPRRIGAAPVYDLDGHRVGQVQKLDADPSGKPTGMEIWLVSGRTVSVLASNIGYDEQQNIVTAGLTDAQLGLLPGGSAPPGPQPSQR